MMVRRAIEEAKIPFTYISANCFAGYFVGNLSQMGTLIPPKGSQVQLYGDGNVKVAYNDEDDIAAYTLKTINDPRILNKTLYIRPLENVLSQVELVGIWEKLIGIKFEKCSIPEDHFLSIMKGLDFMAGVEWGHFYHVFYERFTTNFDISQVGGEEASELYPEVLYTRMPDYLMQYL
ncbi:hypothetical protein QQ045_000304 [Rhodiola kirilowii]